MDEKENGETMMSKHYVWILASSAERGGVAAGSFSRICHVNIHLWL